MNNWKPKMFKRALSMVPPTPQQKKEVQLTQHIQNLCAETMKS